MTRCTRSRHRAVAHVFAALALLAGSLAPKDVRPGRLVVTAAPEITLDGKPDRLSPGSRIRNLNNLLVMSASITGQDIPVVYRRDAAGLVHEVWVLTPDEYRRLGGVDASSAEGFKRLNELLALIFGARK